MRLAFEKNGDPSPKSILITGETDLNTLELSFPVIVKPTDRSGSRGVFKLSGPEGLSDAIQCAMDQGFEKQALIEEFAEGKEYSVEYISYRGHHYFLAVTEKFTTGAPHFIETGHRQPVPLEEPVLEQVKAVVSHALDSLEICNGASHSEIKIDKDGTIKIIEIGGRMGGDCIGSDLVRYSTGFDFVKMVIDTACGTMPDFTQVCEPGPVAIRFILTEQDLKEFYELKSREPDRLLKLVDLHPERIGKTLDSSGRAGCYLYRP